MASHSVRLGGAGALEVVRRGPPEDLIGLRSTVARLRAAAGTGVVELVAVIDDGDLLEVVLAYAGRCLDGPVPAGDVARIGAALAASLGDLHERGVVHGAIAKEHVLVDADGIPRLCGFGGDGRGAPSDDVLALGALLHDLLDASDGSSAAEAIAGVADRCSAPDPAARPTMASVAATLAAAGTPRRAIFPRIERSPSPRRRSRTIVVAVATPIAVVLAALVFLGGTAREHGRREQVTSDLSVATTRGSTTTTTERPHRVWPAAAPHTINANGTWTFGSEDDRILLGDWSCRGVPTPALVQPSGAVYVIDDWIDGTAARFVTTVDGAVDVRVEHANDCDALVVTTTDGRTVRPELRAA